MMIIMLRMMLNVKSHFAGVRVRLAEPQVLAAITNIDVTRTARAMAAASAARSEFRRKRLNAPWRRIGTCASVRQRACERRLGV
jgi:hypothetical protein